MGAVRGRALDAVVGVGGIGREARSHNIHGKIDWVGLGPKKHAALGYRGPILTFAQIREFDGKGPLLRDFAPRIAARMYDGNPRMVMSFSAEEWAELEGILKLADGAPSSHRQRQACGARGAGVRASVRITFTDPTAASRIDFCRPSGAGTRPRSRMSKIAGDSTLVRAAADCRWLG